ncbi:CLIP-associating family protein [Striga asiatica]|uniref:CLIP-associating family protein n=1 Tax=Striga asiatica TaxID=4170 RepID=A0A5A7NXF8_STRAF|nr:CLIP-associating family protein [Striga asiatica]
MPDTIGDLIANMVNGRARFALTSVVVIFTGVKPNDSIPRSCLSRKLARRGTGGAALQGLRGAVVCKAESSVRVVAWARRGEGLWRGAAGWHGEVAAGDAARHGHGRGQLVSVHVFTFRTRLYSEQVDGPLYDGPPIFDEEPPGQEEFLMEPLTDVDITNMEKRSIPSMCDAMRVILTTCDNRVVASQQVFGYVRQFAKLGIAAVLVVSSQRLFVSGLVSPAEIDVEFHDVVVLKYVKKVLETLVVYLLRRRELFSHRAFVPALQTNATFNIRVRQGETPGDCCHGRQIRSRTLLIVVHRAPKATSAAGMEEALELARAKDTKERMAGVERLYQLLEASRKVLSPSEVTSLVDVCLDLLNDGNFRVSQGALQALASAVVLSGDHFKLHFNALVPAVVERLGDAKQPVRDAARRLLLTLMEIHLLCRICFIPLAEVCCTFCLFAIPEAVLSYCPLSISSPTIIVERAGSYAWTHKSWRVREEFARTVTSASSLFASTELPLQRAILPPILQMLNDPNSGVRDAAISCIEEMYTQAGPQFREELNRHQLPTSMLKDINTRLEKIEPKVRSTDAITSNYTSSEIKPTNLNTKKSSPKARSSTREVSLFGADGDITERPVEPIKVYSEKELIREFEKIASTLVPDQDWSIRIAAMQRVEGLVIGGATDYSCFHGLLKQLVTPLTTQLSDRRSSIVKQACHLLSFLSKDLLGDFEACAEMFIPALFKLVVITVLVIAESADNCIKTMLRNCKVSRSLPRIVDSAKNDRNAVLRARCCEYALLILEHWADAPEIHRSADLYADLIRCCVADAMSEVRSTARTCYRMFAKTWPERSRRLFLSFDPVVQRVINDEDGGMHRRHASPSFRDRSSNMSFTSQTSAPSNIPGYGTSAIVAMDRSSSIHSASSLSSGLLLSQTKASGKGTDRSLESVLHSSKQKVSAIESMLRGLDMSGKSRSSSLDLAINILGPSAGVDPPSSRDPPFPLAVPASSSLVNSIVDSMPGLSKSNIRNGGLAMPDVKTQFQASKLSGKSAYQSSVGSEPLPVYSYAAKRGSEKVPERGLVDENSDFRDIRRSMTSSVDKQYLDTQYRDSQNQIPNFQRPLLRKNAAGRMSAGRRRSFDESQFSLGDLSSFSDGPASLNDALSEGLNSSSNWSARVAAFNFVHSLLQQGPRGVQEIVQSFEKVMKLFFQHLDDPHHKVAQAALSTLADLIPACRKPFESYMERILPHVFSRLIDPKEVVRQPCSTTLGIVGKTYGTDSLLPALLRSLDEQRSPKAKLAVIEFAIGSFNKHAPNSEGSANPGILNLWLAKLVPLVHDKNTKLKEAAITCIISVYTHYDSAAVLNYILSLSVEEQNSLRRALKQYTPRIEVDLMTFLQSKKDRRGKSSYDPSDVVGTSSEEGYIGAVKKSHLFGKYHSASVDSDGGRKWGSLQDASHITGSISNLTSDDAAHNENLNHQVLEINSNPDVPTSNYKTLNYDSNTTADIIRARSMDSHANVESSSTPHFDINGLIGSDHLQKSSDFEVDNLSSEVTLNKHKLPDIKVNATAESGPSIPKILHLISNDESPSANKRDALQQLIEVSVSNDQSIWSKYFNQILTTILEVLDDSDSSIRELALAIIVEMVKNQKVAMEDSVEIVIDKLLHAIKDVVPKVSSESENCLTIVLAQYDPLRCLDVIVPLLVDEDERTLVTCINCLTKLVGRLSQEELTAQLPSFLPHLFDAFGNQSADVRKTVVFCLVDIYIILGKAFLPYLEGLNSTQLRLVTIYANRISQARTGTPINATQ